MSEDPHGAGWPEPAAGKRILYHCADARSFRVLWALEELGLDYELVLLPFPPRMRTPAYLDINPLGTVPTYFDGAVKMTESAAIVQFLSDTYGGSLRVDPKEAAYGAYLNALHFGEATLTFPQTLVLRYALFEPAARRAPQVATDYGEWFLSRLSHAPVPKDGDSFIAGGRFTAADISVGYALKLAEKLGLLSDASPDAQTYWRRLQSTDGYVRAMKVQEEAAKRCGVAPTDVPPIWPRGQIRT